MNEFLISPVNGYQCKRITKQNISQFGFSSIDELHQQYPGFPLVCENYRLSLIQSSAKGSIVSKQIAKDFQQKYLDNPKICKQCHKAISYENRHNEFFCDHSCAAIFNNKEKPSRTNESRQKIKQIMLDKGYENYLSNPKKCKTYDNHISYEHKRRKLCDTCRYNLKHTFRESNIAYRRACNFKLNKRDHPTLFDNQLLTEIGWYMPVNKGNNINGASFDHLYRVSDGFKNNVEPEIMKHPANAELIPHNINQLRRKSVISLEELKRRIELWDSGERNLRNYYKERGF